MKYLNDYTEEATTKALKNAGALFAFNDKQLNEQKKEDIKYITIGLGLVCPEHNAKDLIKKLGDITKDGITQDILENGTEGIIKRELSNHEVYYTGDISSVVDALAGYEGITKETILEVYKKKK